MNPNKVFWISITVLDSLVMLAVALPSHRDNNIAVSEAPSSEESTPSTVIIRPITQTDDGVKNVSTVTSTLIKSSLKPENAGATVQKTVSFSAQISEEIGGCQSASSSLESYDSSEISESLSASEEEEDFSCILQRQTSFEPSGALEKEFVQHFGAQK